LVYLIAVTKFNSGLYAVYDVSGIACPFWQNVYVSRGYQSVSDREAQPTQDGGSEGETRQGVTGERFGPVEST